MKKITAKKPTGKTNGSASRPATKTGDSGSADTDVTPIGRAGKTTVITAATPPAAPQVSNPKNLMSSAQKISPAPSVPAEPAPPAATASKKVDKKTATKTPAVEPAPAPAASSSSRRKVPKVAPPLEIPPILLQGDVEPVVSASGPGEKYSLGSRAPAQSFTGGELPDSYGTKKLFLTARDPHWLYAHWDLTRDQQNEYNTLSTDGHLVLRIFAGRIEGHPACEIHVHPESRHWFAHVERAGASYAAELGYYSSLGQWKRVAVSSGTVTPPDAAAAESEAEFATIPFEFPFPKLMHIVEEAVRDNVPLAQAIEELRRHGHPDLPRFSSTGFCSTAIAPSPVAAPEAGVAAIAGSPAAAAPPRPVKGSCEPRVWTPEQERALAKIIKIDETRRVWMGSLEITELIRRRLVLEASSPVAGFTSPAGYVPGGVSSALAAVAAFASPGSSPAAPAEKPKSFWFNVNAELIIYGATEPNARVTLGGHEIKLRADGTFSFRFSLPDGKYDLPAVAVSADGTDGRAAELKFSRETEYRGEVGVTPQDPALKPPLTDSL